MVLEGRVRLAVDDVLVDLVGDREDMVVKALSWAVRSLVDRDAAAVSAYLDRHGDALAPRVRRETQRKLETGRKN